MYKITLSDGTQLENLELNGNNYIAQGKISNAVFDGKLGTVKISDGEIEEIYPDMVLLSNIVREGKSWLVFGQSSEQQKAEESRNRTIEELRQAMTVLLTGKEV